VARLTGVGMAQVRPALGLLTACGINGWENQKTVEVFIYGNVRYHIACQSNTLKLHPPKRCTQVCLEHSKRAPISLNFEYHFNAVKASSIYPGSILLTSYAQSRDDAFQRP
jgi:hypothetical protein